MIDAHIDKRLDIFFLQKLFDEFNTCFISKGEPDGKPLVCIDKKNREFRFKLNLKDTIKNTRKAYKTQKHEQQAKDLFQKFNNTMHKAAPFIDYVVDSISERIAEVNLKDFLINFILLGDFFARKMKK